MSTFPIRTKVILILLLLTTTMIVGMALSMQIGFNKGFLNYRQAINDQFNQNLIAALTDYYATNKNWEGLRDSRRQWHDIINQSAIEPEQPFPQPPEMKDHGPKRNSSDHPPKRRPPRDIGHEGFGPPMFGDGPPPPGGLPGGNHGRPDFGILPPVTLFDQHKAYVIGMHDWRSQHFNFHPVRYKGQLVGYLGTLKENKHFDKQDEIFKNNIQTMLVRLGLFMVTLSILISFPISRYFTRAVNQISRAAQKIAKGDFSTRIQLERRDELGLLASNFNLLARSLESSAASKNSMMADIAHELRTPISVLLSEIEAIQDGVHTANNQKLKLLQAQAYQLKGLVEDLHDLSSSELGSLKYKMSQVRLDTIITEVCEDLGPTILANELELTLNVCDQKLWVLADIKRIRQLLINLLTNSIHYTHPGGKVVLKAERQGKNACITVNDTKPGVQGDQLEKIFKRWYRGEKSRSRNTGGSGLGLAICKEIVNAHNGEIRATKSELGGLSIQVIIPIAEGNSNASL